MLRIIVLAAIGGVLGASIAYPHGVLAAALAYLLGSLLFAGLAMLSHRLPRISKQESRAPTAVTQEDVEGDNASSRRPLKKGGSATRKVLERADTPLV